MNKRRMEALAKFIEKLPPEHFNMEEWVIRGTSDNPYFCKKDVLHSCNTTCCIAGWQAIKAGYCLDGRGDVYEKGNSAAILHSSYWAAEYLDLTHDQAWALFRKSAWPYALKYKEDSPQLAAERIRLMITTGE